MTASMAAVAPRMSRFRWTICALLFFATTISYLDRQVLSFLAKTLETSLGWNSIQYGYITAAFSAAYAIGLLIAGRLMDKLGTRRGFALAMGVWSLAAAAHAAAATKLALRSAAFAVHLCDAAYGFVWGLFHGGGGAAHIAASRVVLVCITFGAARVLLGLGESANFPACIKTLAEWFPKRERALAAGVFNSGSNVGAIVAPLVVPWLAVSFGWQSAFIASGSLGFVWIAFWLVIYRKPARHKKVSAAELAYIESDPPDAVESVPWRRLFPKSGTWAYGLGKFLTDPVWWFYLFWLPKYLQETFHLSLTQVILPMIVVYNMSTVGSVGGGWLSSGLIQRGWTVNSARKTAMLGCALCVLPVLYAPFCKSLWVMLALVGLGMAAHQGWSANLYTIVSDMFPRSAVGSVTGIGGTLGAVGSVLMQIVTGYVVQLTHSYVPLFLFSGVAYVAALGVVQLLAPKLAAAELG